jgi:hypothetical protein
VPRKCSFIPKMKSVRERSCGMLSKAHRRSDLVRA